jgi:hypothetical protein
MKGLPLVRLQWFVMSTEHLEKRPVNKLIVDAYQNGSFVPTIKTIARTEYLTHWGYSHHPTGFTKEAPPFNATLSLSEFAINPVFNPREEVAELQFQSNLPPNATCRVPNYPLYVRHYQGMNYEDFVKLHGTQKYDSMGHWNPYSIDTRYDTTHSLKLIYRPVFNFYYSKISMAGEIFSNPKVLQGYFGEVQISDSAFSAEVYSDQTRTE